MTVGGKLGRGGGKARVTTGKSAWVGDYARGVDDGRERRARSEEEEPRDLFMRRVRARKKETLLTEP